MKKLTIAFLAVLSAIVLASCASEPTALEKALSDSVVAGNPGLEKVEISSVVLRDSVCVRQELARRVRLFETKLSAEKKRNSTPKQIAAVQHVSDILEALQEYSLRMESSSDSTIYYIYDFEVAGKMSDGAAVPRTEMSATVDCSGNVLRLFTPGSNVYSGMGIALPGYRELLESLHASE